MGMTMAEKILARASGQTEVVPGQVVVCTVDLAVQSDASFSGYWMMDAWPAVVFDRERVILTTGASAPATGLRAAETHSLMRRFAARHIRATSSTGQPANTATTWVATWSGSDRPSRR